MSLADEIGVIKIPLRRKPGNSPPHILIRRSKIADEPRSLYLCRYCFETVTFIGAEVGRYYVHTNGEGQPCLTIRQIVRGARP